MKKRLLGIVGLLLVLLVLAGWNSGRSPVVTISDAALAMAIELRNPNDILAELLDQYQEQRLTHGILRDVLPRLRMLQSRGTRAQRVAANCVLSQLYLQTGYWTRAREHAEAALMESTEVVERHDVLALEFRIARQQKDLDGMARSIADLRKLGVEKAIVDVYEKTLASLRTPFPGSWRPGWLALWIIAFAAPFLVMLRRTRAFAARFERDPDRVSAFTAFRRSPLALLTSLISAIVLMVLQVPQRLGLPHNLLPCVIHFFAAFCLALVPFYRLDRTIRKVSWSFASFLRLLVQVSVLQSFFLLVGGLTCYILHLMAASAPMWAIRSPLSFGLGFPAIAGALLLVLPLGIPWLFAARRPASDERSGPRTGLSRPCLIWEIPESGLYNALSYGFISRTQGFLVSRPLFNEFSDADLAAILAHEEGHFAGDHLFQMFLVQFAVFFGLGIIAATQPLMMQTVLLLGPNALHILALFVGYFIFTRIWHTLALRWEHEADRFAADRVGREEYLAALTRLTSANFLPHHWREEDNARWSHPSLKARATHLRSRDGKVFSSPSAVPPGVLVALWRSRLAHDWKCGHAETVELCALDDDFHGVAADRPFPALAERQARFGAEALVTHDGSELAVLVCPQKRAALEADPPLPAEKICALCSEGMIKAVGRELRWNGTSNGCRLRVPASPIASG
jgi:Zn-dependent protease with chaperone function